MKKTLIVTSILAASVFASAVNAATINVSGNIRATPCVVSTTASSITMPDINLNDLGRLTGVVANTSAQDIIIKLTGCPAMVQTAKVTFTGKADSDNDKALELNGVKGVALALFEQNSSTAIDINTAAADQSLDGSETHDLAYKAKYITTKTVFEPGTATATLNFDVAYN